MLWTYRLLDLCPSPFLWLADNWNLKIPENLQFPLEPGTEESGSYLISSRQVGYRDVTKSCWHISKPCLAYHTLTEIKMSLQTFEIWRNFILWWKNFSLWEFLNSLFSRVETHHIPEIRPEKWVKRFSAVLSVLSEQAPCKSFLLLYLYLRSPVPT